MTPMHPGSTLIGAEIAGYKILEEIARGSAGAVYRARQISLNRIVAIKVLLPGGMPGGSSSEAEVARFYAEARVVAKLRHPNIVPVFDVGRFGDSHYIAMEYVEGEPLSAAMRRRVFSPDEALDVVEKAAEALECAHKAGIIHRDVKPANIMLDRQGSVRVMDFGLAKQLEAEPNLTRTGITMGTPNYMSPEQARGDNRGVDARSDVYSLGAVLYELLTGSPPHADESNLKTILKVINEEPVPPRKVLPQIPNDVQTICLKAMEKTKGRRYAAAGEMALDIRRFKAGEPILARPSSPTWRLYKKLVRHRRTAVIVAAAVLVASFLTTLIGQKHQLPTAPPSDAGTTNGTVTGAGNGEPFNVVEMWRDEFNGTLAGWRTAAGEGEPWQIADQILTVQTRQESRIESVQSFDGDVAVSFDLMSSSLVGGSFAVFIGGRGEPPADALEAWLTLSDDGGTVNGAALLRGRTNLKKTATHIPLRGAYKKVILRYWAGTLSLLVDDRPVISEAAADLSAPGETSQEAGLLLPTMPAATNGSGFAAGPLKGGGGTVGFRAIGTSMLIDNVAVRRMVPPYEKLKERADQERIDRRYGEAGRDYGDLLEFYGKRRIDGKDRPKGELAELEYWRCYCGLADRGLFAEEMKLEPGEKQRAIDELTGIAKMYDPADKSGSPINDFALRADYLHGALLVRSDSGDNVEALKHIDEIARKYGKDPEEVFEGVFRSFPHQIAQRLQEQLVDRADLTPAALKIYLEVKQNAIKDNENKGNWKAAGEESLNLAAFHLKGRTEGRQVREAIAVLENAMEYPRQPLDPNGLPLALTGRLRNLLGYAYLDAESYGEAVRTFLTDQHRMRDAEPIIAAEADLGLATAPFRQRNYDAAITILEGAADFRTGAQDLVFPQAEPKEPVVEDPDSPEGKGLLLQYLKDHEAWEMGRRDWMKQNKEALLTWADVAVRAGEIRRKMLYMAAEAYKRRNPPRLDRAIATLEALAAKGDQSEAERARARRTIGDIYRLDERYEQARAAYWDILKTFVELRTECATARIRLGETFILSKDYAAAGKEFAFVEHERYREETDLLMDAINKRGLAMMMRAAQPGLSSEESESLRQQAVALWDELPRRFTSAGLDNPNVQIAWMLSRPESESVGNLDANEKDLDRLDQPTRASMETWCGVRSEMEGKPDQAKEYYRHVLEYDHLGTDWPAAWARSRLEEKVGGRQ